MNTETFLANFHTIANAPGGIARLREMILQLAVQGKLVEQNPNDEPASELLKKIEAEKEKSLTTKNTKGGIEPIKDEDKPYKLPSNWEWVRLGDIYVTNGQKTPDKKFSYIDVAAINKELGFIDDNEIKILDAKNAPSRARKIVKKGNVIYSTVRPYLLNIAW